ncbi:MAG: ferredoxin--NAD(+) reductase, partial [Actinomycetospora chiangmaiensis]|nr:ferredoxin--NAD(+) reductase [Actinomycetospora chiangmaiensis]
MGARCSLVVNGRSVRVSTGDTPLEAALAEGMIAPVQTQAGTPLAGQGVAHQGAARPARRPPAHRARPESLRPGLPAAPIPGQVEAPPIPVAVRKGTVTEIRRLSPGIVEVVATLTKRPTLEPGHQARVTFAGLPTLTLAPTLRVDGAAELNEAVFHIPRDPEGGWVDAIRLDQPMRLKGPVGRGQYRPGGGRLVLVAAGAGFGAIWAIARA